MSTESAVKHTPGPWDVTEIGTIEDRSHNPRQICSINRWNREANACLIAAAPALLSDGAEFLSATESLLDWMNGNDLSADHADNCPADYGRLCAALAKFQAAIRQAKGE